MPKKKTHDGFINEVNGLVADEYSVIGLYANNTTKLLMRHNKCGNEYLVSPNKFLSGRRCPRCAYKNMRKKEKKSTAQFREEVALLVGNEYSVLDEYKGSMQRLRIRHNSCGNVQDVMPCNFVHRGSRCPICSKGDPYEKTVCNRGYVGVGQFSPCANKVSRAPYYRVWDSMIRRCYSPKAHMKQPTYIGCSVCDEWLNLQTFAGWYVENYYTIKGERIELDKDILVDGNKVYSPATCIFVPSSINSMFRANTQLAEEYMANVVKGYTGQIPERVYKAVMARIATMSRDTNLVAD